MMELMLRSFCIIVLLTSVLVVAWPSWTHSGLNLRRMLLSTNEEYLFVVGESSVYQLWSTNLSQIATYTYPDVTITLAFNNDMSTITTCSNSSQDCVVHQVSNITSTNEQSELKIETSNATTLVVDDTVFIACPHNRLEQSNGQCEDPGIFWKTYNENENKFTGQNSIKMEKDAQVKTIKYLKAFAHGEHRLFFSIQKVRRNKFTTRVAHLCKKEDIDLTYTYVDMEIHCGSKEENLLMTDAATFYFDDALHVIGVFSSTKKQSSAVCVYPLLEIEERFIQNFNVCHKGTYNQNTPSNYFRRNHNNCRGQSSILESEYLCGGFPSYYNVIGIHSLDATPVLTYNATIQSIAVVEKRLEIVAFLGTADDGGILKAIVHPAARKLQDTISMGYGKVVLEDMYISEDKKDLLAMTNSKVDRIPIQQCATVQGCDACLGGKDPYCGWCILETRCTIEEDCEADWIQASDSTSSCPSIREVNMPYISADISTLLSVTLSHLPQHVSLTCHFHTSEPGTTFSQRVNATINSLVLNTIETTTPNIQSIATNIKGSLVMKLSILSNVSNVPFVEGYITYYNCETFTGCSSCIQKEWECDWCIYKESCQKMNSSINCSGDKRIPHTENNGTGSCPSVTGVQIKADRKDDVYFLSTFSKYTVIMNGTNFPQPEGNMSYSCHVSMTTDVSYPAVYMSDTMVMCNISRIQLTQGQVEPVLHLNWGSLPVIGSDLKVSFYNCEYLAGSCGECKSFVEYQPHFQCHWCNNKCISTEMECTEIDSPCPDPTIVQVLPLSAAVNASIVLTIRGLNLGSSYNETVNAVTVGGLQCHSIKDKYIPSKSIVCDLEASPIEMSAAVNVTLPNKQSVLYKAEQFKFLVPKVLGIFPSIGPQSGGTRVTINGQHLNAGNEKHIYLGNEECLNSQQAGTDKLTCITREVETSNGPLTVKVKYENSTVIEGENVTFSYNIDPTITEIAPMKSFLQGGRRLTIKGTNLHAIQAPLIYATFHNGKESNHTLCENHSKTTIFCKSPVFIGPKNAENPQRSKRETEKPPETARLSFVMDGVQSVRNLDEDISTMFYYQNPLIHEFTKPEQYHDILVIRGERLAVAAVQDDVNVYVGRVDCNVTSLKNDSIYCNPPEYEVVQKDDVSLFPIKVHIGYFHSYVGLLQYKTDEEENNTTMYIIAGVAVPLVLILAIVLLILRKTYVKGRAANKEKEGLEYRLDRMEATLRTQCREEFAILQTTVSDLTSDLAGGNALFRDYHTYACKTLFSSTRSQNTIMSRPPAMVKTSSQALDNFKGLLRNTNFLLMFIRTLEKQKTFTIQDKSHVATILMVLNHDNLEFITDILKTLLNDLVDKNIAAQTPKLMLRRSENVSEKLLTHWLGICLYHYLKDSSGSALYILYKAIKTQVEKGPVDYITGCGRNTLSEDRLFTSADTAVNAKTLILEVTHFDYIDNEEKQISAHVLDCDTITQAKAKMLEIIYKNVPYSQRPPVHKTILKVHEEDRTSRVLNDEDCSSVKEGLWKKINTLQHYAVADGSKASLIHNKEIEIGSSSLAEATPDAYIVGSYRKSRPAVRTISGSNYWHLTKQNIGEDEVKISSDFFLPRLLNTKGTLQMYIDDLFTAILTMGDEPPIIIKYLFDFLDGAAERHSITDPDVLHTWKCNSLLLRFWVNIVKNPEFVFDIHKPNIVDSCLSAITQTLMDSCSTADLQLGIHSPSNKLLFAKDIPRYKKMVKKYFEDMQNKPPVSDQDLNSYLTERVAQKFSGNFTTTSALLEMYKFASQYKTVLMNEMDNLEASSPGSFFQLSSKLESVCASLDLPE